MAYVTHLQLAERPGARELAQVASPDHAAVVADELMDATLRGGDRAAWSEDERAVADAALARIDQVVAQADSLIDGFLVKRGYPLPLNPVPLIVAAWATAIARYQLHKDRIGDEKTDPIARDYRDAMKLLQLTSTGQFSLGADDP
ncbi:hypothetical protein CLD22_26605, partial [Rubrivivax gelatinosus]|nr:hypothetical protein [Rubrivivax gelatinosus]